MARQDRVDQRPPRRIVKLLLTSAGIKNASIQDALVDLLSKPIAESSALCIPTASHANPGGPGQAWKFISGREPRTPMCELGWMSLGVLELTALPSIDEELWVPTLRDTDVLLVNGGDPLYLSYWMRQSGLADILPSLREAVYVGLSAGSMVMAPRIGEDFARWKPPTGGDKTLGLVDFSIFPHLDHEDHRPAQCSARAPRFPSSTARPVHPRVVGVGARGGEGVLFGHRHNLDDRETACVQMRTQGRHDGLSLHIHRVPDLQAGAGVAGDGVHRSPRAGRRCSPAR